MRQALISAALAVTALAGCAGDPERFAVPTTVTPTAAQRIGIAYRSVEVLEVSLPAYAALDEISVRGEGGALTALSDTLWADAPSRSVTLELSRHLAQLTGARVAPEPWPFYDRAGARVDVRVEEMVAQGASSFTMTGQWFVAPELGGRDRSGLFTLSAPIAPESGTNGIAAARAQVVLDLAAEIARKGLR